MVVAVDRIGHLEDATKWVRSQLDVSVRWCWTGQSPVIFGEDLWSAPGRALEADSAAAHGAIEARPG